MFALGLWAASKTDDATIYVTALREQDIEAKILNSPIMQECQGRISQAQSQGDATKGELRECFEQVMNAADDEDVEKLAGDFNLDSLNFEATKSAEAIREYLSHRLSSALYGKDYEKKRLREKRLVGQNQFLKLYKAQISKNLVMEISQYCLENVGVVANPGALLLFEQDPQDSQKRQLFKVDLFQKDSENKTYSAIDPSPSLEQRRPIATGANFWDQIAEYRYCPSFDDDRQSPCWYENARNQEMISALKEKELELAAGHDPKVLGQRYLFCSTQIVKNMCEIYRCNNVYTTESLEKNRKRCLSEYGINVTRQSSSFSLEVSDQASKKGQLACGLISKVETYKKTLEAIEEIEQGNKELKDYTGIDMVEAGFHAGAYDGTKKTDSLSIDEVTSISSKELVNEAQELKNINEDLKDLKQKCIDANSGALNAQDPDCAELSNGINAQNMAQIEVATEAQTEAYLRRVRELNEENDPEKLKEFLIKHGLHEYVEKMDEFPVNELVKLIEDKYRSERQALINNMKDRFYAQTRIKKENEDKSGQNISQVATEQIDEIEKHTQRLETLINYSNIVSSYLELKDENDPSGETFANTGSRAVEAQGYQEHASDEAAKYDIYFQDTQSSTDNAAGFSAQGSFIDSILGFGEAEP